MGSAYHDPSSIFENQDNSDSLDFENRQMALIFAAALEAQRADDAWYAAAQTGVRATYESEYYADLADYLNADAAAHSAYASALETAQRELSDEQCRLAGLLQDSINTGVNSVLNGTTSLDVQVCFVAGTKIRLKNGEVKSIEELKKGWFSRSAQHDDPTGEIGDFEIVELYENETDRLVEIVFENPSTEKRFSTKSTPEHPFFVYGKGWVAAKDVLSGDECRSASDQRITVVSVTELEESCKVYNFQVKSAHTYFVGESDDESVLVHNECEVHQDYYDAMCTACQFGNPSNWDLDKMKQAAPAPDPPPYQPTIHVIEGRDFWTTGDVFGAMLGIGMTPVIWAGGKLAIKHLAAYFFEETFSATTGLPAINPKDAVDAAKSVKKLVTKADDIKPARIIVNERNPSLSDPTVDGVFQGGDYDPGNNPLYLGGGGHPNNMSAAGGDPTDFTSGITVFQSNPDGQYLRIFWANDSASLPRSLLPSEKMSIQTGLEFQFPHGVVMPANRCSELVEFLYK